MHWNRTWIVPSCDVVVYVCLIKTFRFDEDKSNRSEISRKINELSALNVFKKQRYRIRKIIVNRKTQYVSVKREITRLLGRQYNNWLHRKTIDQVPQLKATHFIETIIKVTIFYIQNAHPSIKRHIFAFVFCFFSVLLYSFH